METLARTGDTFGHGIVRNLTPGASIDQWAKESGLDFDVLSGKTYFNLCNQIDGQPLAHYRTLGQPLAHYRTLYRSDNLAPLSVVSDRYKVVQPREILAFYDDITRAAGIELESAGILRGGKRIFAFADTGKEIDINGDILKIYSLLHTSFDGKAATVALMTTRRLWCSNQLDIFLNRGAGEFTPRVRVSHVAKFDVNRARAVLGLGDINWFAEEFTDSLRILAERSVSYGESIDYYAKVFYGEERYDNLIGRKVASNLSEFNQAFLLSPGQMGPARWTAWGLLNAVTYLIDHKSKSRSPDAANDNAWFGRGARIKQIAFTEAMKLAA